MSEKLTARTTLPRATLADYLHAVQGGVSYKAALETLLLPGVPWWNSRDVEDCLIPDGVTSNRDAYWALGSPGAVAGLPISVFSKFTVASPVSLSAYPWAIGDSSLLSGDPAGRPNSLTLFVTPAGELAVKQTGASATDYRRIGWTGFVTEFSGLNVNVAVVFTEGDSATDPIIYINGNDRTSDFSETTNGTVPNWVDASLLDDDYFLAAHRYPVGRVTPYGPIIGALSASEVLVWAQTGRWPSWAEIAAGSATVQTSGTLTIGRKYRIQTFVSGDSFTNVGAASNATGVEFVATRTTPTTWTNSSQLMTLGPVFRPIIQPISIIADAGQNQIAGIVTAGISPITKRRDWAIQGQTSTNGNQQLLGASVFADSTRHMIDSIEVSATGTPTVGVGHTSGGAQYVAAAAVAAGRNRRTLVTPIVGGTAVWISSTTTGALKHTIRGHLIDV